MYLSRARDALQIWKRDNLSYSAGSIWPVRVYACEREYSWHRPALYHCERYFPAERANHIEAAFTGVRARII